MSSHSNAPGVPQTTSGEAAQKFDIIVLGGGSAGLAAARRARELGASVALVEKEVLGGECPNTACVPAKALLRSAAAIREIRHAKALGIDAGEPQADWQAVRARVRGITGADEGDTPTQERLNRQGIAVFRGMGEFTASDRVQVGQHTLAAPRILLTSGSFDRIPPIEGLEKAGYLTHKDVLELGVLPASIAIIGAGPVGVEYAQIFAPLGVQVTLLMSGPLPLPREDHDISRALLECLRHEPNLHIESGVRVERVEERGGRKVLCVSGAERPTAPTPSRTGRRRDFEVVADAVFLATGHAPSVEGMGLERVGVETNRMGVVADEYLRTTAPNVWAAGDVTGVALFTHIASYQGKLAAHNALLHGDGHRAVEGAPLKADYRVIPRATFCEPEVASIGLTEEECRTQDLPYRAAALPLDAIERSIISSETSGLAKLIVAKDSGEILGAHIIGARAGELIHEIAPLMQARLPVTAISCTIHAFPTFSEIWESVALTLTRRPDDPEVNVHGTSINEDSELRCIMGNHDEPENEWINEIYEGVVCLFCSERCRAAFEADPETHLGETQALVRAPGYS
ncbi:MAG: NAD(P)/FAD-dependent oxidoreductase [Armatimonadetes bacterium]|nr:NAD(P)/FAD-dependent oxidoreductase [Armatimonadota bacterium]